MRRLAPAGALVTLLLGCPPTEQKKKEPAPTASCSKVGQSCEVSPGKLGSCVQKDDCKDPAGCFACQSQH
jgi:hypothetical protein